MYGFFWCSLSLPRLFADRGRTDTVIWLLLDAADRGRLDDDGREAGRDAGRDDDGRERVGERGRPLPRGGDLCILDQGEAGR